MAAARALSAVLSAVLAPGNAEFTSLLTRVNPALAVLHAQGVSVTIAAVTELASGLQEGVNATAVGLAAPPPQSTAQHTLQAAFAPPPSSDRLVNGGSHDAASLLGDSTRLVIGLAIGFGGLFILTVGSALALRRRRKAQSALEERSLPCCAREA